MRAGRIFRAAALLIAPVGCSSPDRDWAGLVLGKRPTAAIPDPREWDPHVVRLAGGPGFPWQSGKARLDRDGMVMAITLTTDCCAEAPMMDRSPTPQEWAETAREERAVPDRFKQGSPPPSVRDVDWLRQPRTISVGDMDHYAAAAMAEAVRRLGPATSVRREAVVAFAGHAQSAIEGPLATRAVWQQAGRTVALLDANHESVCLSVVSPDVPHPPLETACTGVRMDCPASWYSDDRAVGDTLPAGVAPPSFTSAPDAQEPACRPD